MKREPLTSDRSRRAAPRRQRAEQRIDGRRNGAHRRMPLRPRRWPRRRSTARSMPRCARMGADLGVERRPLVADLAHVAEQQPARAGQRRPARRSPRAPNPGWRCSCRRSASTLRPPRCSVLQLRAALDRRRRPRGRARSRPAGSRQPARRPLRPAHCAVVDGRRADRRSAERRRPASSAPAASGCRCHCADAGDIGRARRARRSSSGARRRVRATAAR